MCQWAAGDSSPAQCPGNHQMMVPGSPTRWRRRGRRTRARRYVAFRTSGQGGGHGQTIIIFGYMGMSKWFVLATLCVCAAFVAGDDCAASGKHRQIQLSKLDSSYLDEIKLVEIPIPTPGAGEVLVHIRARPVNPADIFSLMGVYPGFVPKEFPAVPGLEGAGVIAQLGPGVKELWKAEGIDLKVGSRVVPLIFDYVQIGKGSWTEYAVVSATNVVGIPDQVPDESAAQSIVNPLTVLGMLDELLSEVKPEDSQKDIYILQAAAGSTLGKQLIQVAKFRRVKTINLVRRAEQIAELKALGADEVPLRPSF